MNTFSTLCLRLNRVIEALLAGLGLTMAAIVAAQVFARYVLNASLFWSEEAARFLLVWLTFLGATSAYYRGRHPGIDALTKRMAPAGRAVAGLVSHLAALGVAAVMVVYGTWFAWFIRLQISPALGLPKWIVVGIIPIAGVILGLYAIRYITAWRNGVST